jgi:hypothetical protein
MKLALVFSIALGTVLADCPFGAQAKAAGQGEVVSISGLTKGSYRVFAYGDSVVPRFPYRLEIDLADGRKWRALPRFQNQHTDFDEPFEKAPVEMEVAEGGRLLVFAPFTGMPGELIEVTYLAPSAAPLFLYLVNPRPSGWLSGERWYAVRGLAETDAPYTLHWKPSGHGVAGQLLDVSSAPVAEVEGVLHGSLLIGTITPRAGRNQPRGRFCWTFLERGREFEGDWWSGEERRYLTGEKMRKP